MTASTLEDPQRRAREQKFDPALRLRPLAETAALPVGALLLARSLFHQRHTAGFGLPQEVTHRGAHRACEPLVAALSRLMLVERRGGECLLCLAAALLPIAPGLWPTRGGLALALPVLLRPLAAWRRTPPRLGAAAPR